MPYQTGVANNMVALQSAFINACISNGWTLSGAVLHKGSVYIEVSIVAVSGAEYLSLQGGTGVSGGNVLSGASGAHVRLGRPSTAVPDLNWPVTYEVFIGVDPDEVYLIVNYDVDRYQYMAFGQSTIPDLPGSGCWYSASLATFVNNAAGYASCSTFGGGAGSLPTLAPFWRSLSAISNFNSCIHHGLDGATWSTATTLINAGEAVRPLSNALPSAWNSESILLPFHAWMERGSNKLSMVADLQHSRHVRIDNHTPGDIVSIGYESWKIYPFHKKSTVQRDGATAVDHTGTLGWAIRYDGL